MEKLRSIEELIDALKRLPSIGSKSAERMAFALLNFQQDDLDDLANKISSIKRKFIHAQFAAYTPKMRYVRFVMTPREPMN